MVLEGIMLSEISQKDKYHMISLTYGIFKKLIDTWEDETWPRQGCGEERGKRVSEGLKKR